MVGIHCVNELSAFEVRCGVACKLKEGGVCFAAESKAWWPGY